MAFVPGPTASRASGGQGPFVPVGGTNRDKRVAFYPGWWQRPGQKARTAFCPGWSHQPGSKATLLSRLVPPTGIKDPHFVPVGVSNRDKRPLSPPLAWLAVGPGTKAIYCPGPKGSQDKWFGTKACSVVLMARLIEAVCLAANWKCMS